MVTNRFSSMLSIMNAHIKIGSQDCTVPVNKLCLNTLRLFRSYGYIWGFSFTSPGTRTAHLFPRVKILFKYSDVNTPTLKTLRVFKITHSDFKIIRNNQLFKILSQNKLYLLSTAKGLVITSVDNFYNAKVRSNKSYNSGKLLAEIYI